MKKVICIVFVLVMCFALAGCDSNQYEKAMSLYEAGDYERAASIFEELGDYENSVEMAKESKYAKAMSLYEAEDYARAASVFEELGDYKNSAKMAKESKYAYASQLLFEDKEFDSAKRIFGELGNYSDSEELCLECDYRKAEEAFSSGDYKTAISIYELNPTYSDSEMKIAQATRKLMYEKYDDVIQLMSEGVWFYNVSGAINAVNRLTFSGEAAQITVFISDGNGVDSDINRTAKFTVDESYITFTDSYDGEISIPYRVENGTLILDGGYLTPEEVDADLQGYWRVRDFSSEYIYYFEDGKVSYEYAAESYWGSNGEYFYYGPYEGTYTIDENGLNADVSNNWQFAFNVIDGKAVMVRCGHICSSTSGFKGENGYSF